MAGLPERQRRSTLQVFDNGLLVVVGIIAALVVLKIVGLIAGTVFFLVKLALVAGAVYLALRLFLRRK